MSQPPLLSVVLPVYNEAESIVPVLEELQAELENTWPGQWEILAVDDGSSDSSAERILTLASAHSALRLISLQKNVGQSGALWAGCRAARADWTATLDADGQNHPADLPKLWEHHEKADAVFGHRMDRKDTWSKRVGSRWANAIRNRVLHENIIDTGCSLKIFRTSLMHSLTPWNGMHRFLGSLFLMQGAVIEQVPVRHRPRSAGTSKYTNAGRLKRTVSDLFAVRWYRSRYVRPEETPI